MSSILTPRHIVPIDNRGSHSASALCKCSPVVSFLDLATGAEVYRHRPPVTDHEIQCQAYRDHYTAHVYLTGVGWVCRTCRPDRLP
jgi:hypothetical protein